MVDLLVRVEFSQEVWRDAQVVPAHVPLLHEFLIMLAFADGAIVILRVLPHFVAEDFSGNLLYNVVLGAVYVHVQLARLLFLLLFLLVLLLLPWAQLFHLAFLTG